jgi:hypothetical protein
MVFSWLVEAVKVYFPWLIATIPLTLIIVYIICEATGLSFSPGFSHEKFKGESIILFILFVTIFRCISPHIWKKIMMKNGY